MQKIYQITLSEDQLRLIANCIEDCHRFASGQLTDSHTIEEILSELPNDEVIMMQSDIDYHLKQLKKVLFQNLQPNEFKNYNGSEFLGNTYHIYRSILHRLAIDNTLNNVYSSSFLHSGNMGAVRIEQIENI